MPFDDTDLKRLKEIIQEPFRSEYNVGFMNGISISDIHGLLARLEAAEEVFAGGEVHRCRMDHTTYHYIVPSRLDAWRKAAGK